MTANAAPGAREGSHERPFKTTGPQARGTAKFAEDELLKLPLISFGRFEAYFAASSSEPQGGLGRCSIEFGLRFAESFGYDPGQKQSSRSVITSTCQTGEAHVGP